jgi:membrane fusion protein (multidrug efflux system)
MAQDNEQAVATRPEAAPMAPEARAIAQTPKANAVTPALTPGVVIPPRRSRRPLIFGLIAVAAIGYGAMRGYDWFVEGRFIVSTDDAYVEADTATIAARVAGHIVAAPVLNNARVRAGDVLVRIDDGDYRLAVQAAKDKIASQESTIARIARQMQSQRAVIGQTESQIASVRAQNDSAAADMTRASLEFERAQKLAESSFGSQQRLEQADADRKRMAASVASAAAAATSAEAAVTIARANYDVLDAQRVEAEHARDELKTALAKAERDLSFTTVVAPFDGVVGNKSAPVGAYVQPGTRLMAMVPLDSIYVGANFKETQVSGLRPGQKVDVAVDSMNGRVIEGTVQSVAPASGSEFALLPPDNATGNFTKVVQRVGVRIKLPLEEIETGDLRPGLSVVASVHTRDESQPRPTLLGMIGLGETKP